MHKMDPNSEESSVWRRRRPPRQPLLNLPHAIAVLFYGSVALHVFRLFLPENIDNQILFWGGFIPARLSAAIDAGALFSPAGLIGAVLPFLSYIFLHADWMHLLFNMLWLMVFGVIVGRWMGDSRPAAARLILFFFVCGILGALAHFATDIHSTVPLIGGSAGVAGLMAAATRIMFAPYGYRARGRVPLAPIFDQRVLVVAALFLVINLFVGLGDMNMGMQGNAVAWQAHIGGYLAGLLLFPFFDRFPR